MPETLLKHTLESGQEVWAIVDNRITKGEVQTLSVYNWDTKSDKQPVMSYIIKFEGQKYANTINDEKAHLLFSTKEN